MTFEVPPPDPSEPRKQSQPTMPTWPPSEPAQPQSLSQPAYAPPAPYPAAGQSPYPGQAQPPYPGPGQPAYPGQQQYPGQAQYPGQQPYYPAPGGQYPSAYPMYAGADQPRPPRDGYSTAALVFGIIGGIPFALIFGIVGIVRTKWRQRLGRGRAIAGVILSGVWTLIAVVVAIIAIAIADQHISRDANGQITKQQTASPADLRQGDCLNAPDNNGTTVSTITVMPCSQLHNAQDIAEVTIPGSSYPGATQLQSVAGVLCQTKYVQYLGTDQSDLEAYLFYPNKQRWDVEDDHKAHCVLVDTEGQITGDIKSH